MKITTPHTQLFWDNENKKFHTANHHYYDISECPTLTFSFELRINGLEVTWLGTTHTFKSKKALTKFIDRLCEEVKVDWSKVEDGTEIKIINNGNIVKFMKYIPDLKTVIVREGDCFYTIDASEVELC